MSQNLEEQLDDGAQTLVGPTKQKVKKEGLRGTPPFNYNVETSESNISIANVLLKCYWLKDHLVNVVACWNIFKIILKYQKYY